MSEISSQKNGLSEEDALMALLLSKMLDCTRDILYKRVYSIIKDLNTTLTGNKISFYKTSEVKISLDKIDQEFQSSYSGFSSKEIYLSMSEECTREKIYRYAEMEPLNYEMIYKCFGELDHNLCQLIIN